MPRHAAKRPICLFNLQVPGPHGVLAAGSGGAWRPAKERQGRTQEPSLTSADVSGDLFFAAQSQAHSGAVDTEATGWGIEASAGWPLITARELRTGMGGGGGGGGGRLHRSIASLGLGLGPRARRHGPKPCKAVAFSGFAARSGLINTLRALKAPDPWRFSLCKGSGWPGHGWRVLWPGSREISGRRRRTNTCAGPLDR